MKPPRWLKAGDVVRIEIDGIGAIENRCRRTERMTLHSIDRMAVEDDGDGDAVVCVHGLGGTTNTWTPLMAALGSATRHPHRPAGQRPLARAPTRPLSIDALVDACSRCARA